jgi:FkbM family methyltransferase
MGFFDWWRRCLNKDKPARRDLPEPAAAYATELVEIRAQLDFLRTRLATYVGDGSALTYLVDETPIFVNANDVGGPFNLINGGQYEEENTQVLLSFLRPDTVFVDIGANVGYFSIKLGKRLSQNGKIYAFEPHPILYDILKKNVYINALDNKVTCFNFALSDKDTIATLQYPLGHLGGGHLGQPGEAPGHTSITTEMKRLDELLGADFQCDLVKIDVEGHELSVLEGMRKIVENSTDIKILFEKLVMNAGNESATETYFRGMGFALYGVQGNASLVVLGNGGLAEWEGYVLATRLGAITDDLKRTRFSVHSAQLWTPAGPITTSGPYVCNGIKGEMLFHGPYWFLSSGIWRLKFHGTFRGILRVAILQRFGHKLLEFDLDEGQPDHVVVVPRYLVHFECAVYAASPTTELSVERLEFIRES